MAISVVRLGALRAKDEGLRIGTVRRPPRGVRKTDYGTLDYYDVWLPQLAPSAELVKVARKRPGAAGWKAFERQYRRELSGPDTQRLVAVLAALSRTTNFSVGCYCEDETRCHRSILRAVLAEHGAVIR